MKDAFEAAGPPKKHRAPGRADRCGVTVMDAVRMFDTEAKAEAWFPEQRWPNGVYCPHCGPKNVADMASRKPQPWCCRDCRKHFSVKTGTMRHSSNIELSKQAMCIYFCSTNLKGVSSMKWHGDLGIGQKAAWCMAHRIRQVWDQREEPFLSPVEANETYIGGLEKNKHQDKRVAAAGWPVGKAIVDGVRERETGKIAAKVVPDTTAVTLTGLVQGHAEPGAQVFTGEAYGYEHQAVMHSTGEYVNDMAHTNGMESFWSMLKRGYQGTYHKMGCEHLHRYINAFRGRHNQRLLDTLVQMVKVVKGGDGKQTTYEEMIAHGSHARQREQEMTV